MTLRQIQQLLKAELICGEENLDEEIMTACGSDMMSDVLAYVKDRSLLLTGLVNSQVIRTAEMMDFKCVIFVRGKSPDEVMVQMAIDRGMTLMSTPSRMFVACGILFQNGLIGEDEGCSF